MRGWWLTRLMAVVALLTIGLLGALPAQAHEGHDHGAPPPPVSNTVAPRAEASSSDFEMVLIARGADLIVHLDAFQTNTPITDAEIEIDTPIGTVKPAVRPDGSYAVAAPFLKTPGTYNLAVTITARGMVDILATTLTIPPAGGTGSISGNGGWFSTAVAAGETPHNAVDRSLAVWIALAVGFAAGLGVAGLFRRRRGVQAILLVGLTGWMLQPAPAVAEGAPALVQRDIAQRFADGSVFVPKPVQQILAVRTVFTAEKAHNRALELPGRIVPSANASGLVQASVGGRLSPPTGGFKPLGTVVKAGDILAYVRPPLPLADETTQQQQARELDQQISIVTRRVERYRAIERVIARNQLEDAELELKGLQSRRANLDRVKREPEALVAPVDGVIASANAVAGQMAEPNGVIFQIIDPAVLWVEALSYEAQAARGTARALFANGRTIDLDYLGTGFADRNQAVPIHFAIRSNATGLRVGQFVTVLASTSEETRGIAVPREAILRGSNGQALVYEHTNAERFVPRDVRVEPLDGTNVLIVAGIEAGRRIVTQGAELLNQIR